MSILYKIASFLYGESPETDPKARLASLKSVPRLLKLIWQTNPRMALTNIVLRLITSVFPPVMLYIGKLIIDEVVLLVNTKGQHTNEDLWIWVSVEFALAVVLDILNRLINLNDTLLGDLFANKSSVQIIEHAAKLDLYQFENPTFYDKLEKARQQTGGRTYMMTQVLAQLQSIISFAMLGVGLAIFSPWLILVLLIAAVPSFISESRFNTLKYSLTTAWTPQRRELDYIRYMGASDSTAKELKIFNLSDFLSQRFTKLSHEFYEANRKLSIRSAFWGGLLYLLSTGVYYGAYIYIIINTVHGAITLGDLTFLAGSFDRMRSAFQTIMNRFADISSRALYLQDFFDFFDLKPAIISDNSSKKVPRPIQKGFTFEHVSFQYPDKDNYSLKNISFHLKIGEKIALVGENGAGKTTLVKLLARLYEPTEGRILLDGVDLREYDIEDLRSQIGIIFQDYVKFALKVSENIAVGNIKEINNLELIKTAAQKSLADTVVKKFPEGYEQMLARRFKGGVEMSGGEWQKIALARAYMRDAQLVILDEPTASLDARAEHEVFLRFSELITGKMAVLISHRFSTVRMADRILFLENGELKEIGSHEELMQLNGKYADLFRLQAKGYT
ncbi:ABC transporter ATP-binding protein [Thermoflexibacter ruber]|uniref:ATP-binding cassette, subfamily B n=1 Tax=Thermoflexibacter ruber TaxID=1003 RepID=A0A1I2F1Y4_9BACT|nr:ABC transporter ATP-binding protein [Thermoflexibacter ruber]SFE99414.1 ATP-binding cassette, subfamily B [Thermoflexibacter ruber]